MSSTSNAPPTPTGNNDDDFVTPPQRARPVDDHTQGERSVRARLDDSVVAPRAELDDDDIPLSQIRASREAAARAEDDEVDDIDEDQAAINQGIQAAMMVQLFGSDDDEDDDVVVAPQDGIVLKEIKLEASAYGNGSNEVWSVFIKSLPGSAAEKFNLEFGDFNNRPRLAVFGMKTRASGEWLWAKHCNGKSDLLTWVTTHQDSDGSPIGGYVILHDTLMQHKNDIQGIIEELNNILIREEASYKFVMDEAEMEHLKLNMTIKQLHSGKIRICSCNMRAVKTCFKLEDLNLKKLEH